MRSRIDDVDASIPNMRGPVPSVDDRILDIDDRINDVDASIPNMRGPVAKMRHRLPTMHTSMPRLHLLLAPCPGRQKEIARPFAHLCARAWAP
jgi:hypothetical protein